MHDPVFRDADSGIRDTGIGLRGPHVPQLLREKPAVPWLEALADNHLAPGGPARQQLRSVRRHYPLTLHCVGMSIGSTDPLNFEYLHRVRMMMHEVEPAWASDHLCWTSVDGEYFHDLLPLPYTEEALRHVGARIQKIQEFLGRAILIENASSYFRFTINDYSEPDFLNALSRQTGCGLLLDLNNVYVACYNSRTSPYTFIDRLQLDNVEEIHIAGFEDRIDYLLDAHNDLVSQPVWDLFAYVMTRRSNIPALFEWDQALPGLDVLLTEAERADAFRQRYQSCEGY